MTEYSQLIPFKPLKDSTQFTHQARIFKRFRQDNVIPIPNNDEDKKIIESWGVKFGILKLYQGFCVYYYNQLPNGWKLRANPEIFGNGRMVLMDSNEQIRANIFARFSSQSSSIGDFCRVSIVK